MLRRGAQTSPSRVATHGAEAPMSERNSPRSCADDAVEPAAPVTTLPASTSPVAGVAGQLASLTNPGDDS